MLEALYGITFVGAGAAVGAAIGVGKAPVTNIRTGGRSGTLAVAGALPPGVNVIEPEPPPDVAVNCAITFQTSKADVAVAGIGTPALDCVTGATPVGGAAADPKPID